MEYVFLLSEFSLEFSGGEELKNIFILGPKIGYKAVVYSKWMWAMWTSPSFFDILNVEALLINCGNSLDFYFNFTLHPSTI